MSGNTEIPRQDVREFLSYIGFHPGSRECKRAGNAFLIPCPFHNDQNPSMAVYPDGAWCFSGCGGKYYNLAYLASEVKGISYGEALKDLGAENLSPSFEKTVDYRPSEIIHFSEPNPEHFIKAFQEAHAKCSTDFPTQMVEWLQRKKLLEVAQKLDWRWHDGSVYKQWGKGIVIPYVDPASDRAIVYERFRAWNEKEQKFDKVISPFGTKGQPYLSTFRANKRQWLCEGESDCASLFALGESAIGFPGSTAKSIMNTVLAMLNDIELVEEIVLCGDEDAAGQGMNSYIEETAHKIAPRLKIKHYEHVLKDEKADMSDEYVKGVLRLPDEPEKQEQVESPGLKEVEKTLDFDKYVDELSAYLDRCDLYGVDPWTGDDKGVKNLNPNAITDALAPLVDEHFIIVENTRGGEVLIPKLHTSGINHFMLQINNGEHAGVYEVVPDSIALGWVEEQKTEPGAVQMMLVMRCKDLIDIETLDFKG